MNITQESTGDLTAAIKVNLQPEDYKEVVTSELKRYARQASLPGFRPGKVPLGMVKKMVGKAIVVEEVNKLVSKSLSDFLAESKLNILGNPMPLTKLEEDAFDPDCKTEMEFAFEIGLAPDFDVNLDLKETPVTYDISIDDDFLNKEVDALRERHGQTEKPEEAAEGDVLYGRLVEVDGEGNDVEEGFQRMIVLNPSRLEEPKFFKPFLGKKIDDVLKVDLSKLKTDIEEVAKVLYIEKEDLEGLKGKTTNFEIKQINRMAKAEFNEEFFTAVQTSMRLKDTPTDEDTFKSSVREAMVEDMKESAKWYTRNQIQKQLMEANPVSLPDEFLKKWLLENEERYKTEEDVEAGYAEFTQSVNWSLIVEKLQAKNEDLNVDREKLEESIRESVIKNFSDLGDELTDDKVQEYVDYTMNNQEILDMQYRRLRDDLLYTYLDNEIDTKSESIDATAFLEVQKAASEK